MVEVLGYASGAFATRRAGWPSVVAAVALTYVGCLPLVFWAGIAIGTFHDAEQSMALYGTARWDHYLWWGGEVQARVGAGWVLLSTAVAAVVLARRRVPVVLIILGILLSLPAIVVLIAMLEYQAFSTGLYP